jgi:hypothetical protein
VAKLNAIQRIDSIERRIADYDADKEVNSRDVDLLLTAEQRAELAEQIRAQQELRKQRRPERLARYEALHKTAASLWAKCRRADTDTKPQQQSLLRLQNTCSAALREAHAAAVGFLDDEQAQHWMDSVYDSSMVLELTQDCSSAALQSNNDALAKAYERLPIMVSITSTDVRCTQAERFEWLSKPELRKRMLQRVLMEHEQDVGAVYEHEQKRREVRAASVMLDAYFGRIVELTGGRGTVDATQRMSAWSMASRALQQNGFRGLGESRAATERDKEVWAMEDELRARFEAEATEEEREQLALLREMEATSTKKGKHKG